MNTRIRVAVLSLPFLALALPARADFEPPVPIRTVAPSYPQDLRNQGTSGIVSISCLVDDHGNVSDAKVVKASNDAFAEPAMVALLKWRFKPAERDGSAVAIRVTIPIKFTVDG